MLSERCNEGIGLEEVERIWAPLQKSDWMSETNIDHLRSEVVKARRLNRFFQKAKGKSSVIFLEYSSFVDVLSAGELN